jgi:hypothetical protein
VKKPPKGQVRSNPKAEKARLEAEWKAMVAKHAGPLERGAKALGVKSKPVAKKVAPARQSDTIHSNPDGMMGQTPKAKTQVYTGSAIVGIATMHKSNMVPIFNDEAAIEVAQMRRN